MLITKVYLDNSSHNATCSWKKLAFKVTYCYKEFASTVISWSRASVTCNYTANLISKQLTTVFTDKLFISALALAAFMLDNEAESDLSS